MDFELTAKQQALRARARELADGVFADVTAKTTLPTMVMTRITRDGGDGSAGVRSTPVSSVRITADARAV